MSYKLIHTAALTNSKDAYFFLTYNHMKQSSIAHNNATQENTPKKYLNYQISTYQEQIMSHITGYHLFTCGISYK